MIWLAASAVGLAAICTVVVGILVPTAPRHVAVNNGLTRMPQTSTSPADHDHSTGMDVSELERLCSLDLQKPLKDPPPQAGSAAPGQVAPTLSVRLIGMANEPGHSVAILKKADGTVHLCAVGESLDDVGGPVKVIQIQPQKAVVLFSGKSYELLVPPVP